MIANVKYDHMVKLINSQISDADTTYDDDMQILRVIEAYCWTKNQRQTIAPTSSKSSNYFHCVKGRIRNDVTLFKGT